MNRIDRISAILIQLQSRRVVKANDIAERFNISLRTVYRDIRTLEEAGIPLIGEAGVGYSLMDGYRLPPVMFTKDEAVAFLTAEKLMEKLTDPSSDESYKSAMFKIRAVLKGAEKDMLENMDDNIEVLKSRRTFGQTSDLSPLPIILKGIAHRQVLSIKYFANHNRQESERCIEPVGVFMAENFWHLIAWCRLRQDYRDFRLDRILDIETTGEKYRQQHPNLKDFINKSAQEQNMFTIVVKVQADVMPFIEGQKYYNGFVSEERIGDQIQMTFLTQWIEGFARWYISYGDYAEIITPPALKEKVKEIARKIIG